MLNSIKILKRYCKATLNVFLIKKTFVDDKKNYLYDRFFESNRNLTILHVKIFKIPGFFSKFLEFQVF